MYSMTGYGNGQCKRHGKKITVMASTINRKQMDLRISLPKELLQFEQEFRKRVTRDIHRGAVTVLVDFTDEAGIPTNAAVNIPLAKSLWESLKTLKQELGVEQELKLTDLLAVPEVFMVGAPEISEAELLSMAMEALEPAITGVMETREEEGNALHEDIVQRRENLVAILREIEKLAPRVPEIYRNRLNARLAELDGEIGVDDERILKEVMFFGERSDVTEETIRLASHLEQMLHLFDTEGPIGRKLDFLIQELVREINTIGSKATDKDIAMQVVEFKAELERIREQVQNIE